MISGRTLNQIVNLLEVPSLYILKAHTACMYYEDPKIVMITKYLFIICQTGLADKCVDISSLTEIAQTFTSITIRFKFVKL